MQKRDIMAAVMSVGMVATGIFAIMHSHLNEVNANEVNANEVNANEVTIIENGERTTFTTQADNVLEALLESPVTFGNFDEVVNVEKEYTVYDGIEIEINRAIPVVINDGGVRFHAMTTASNIEHVLEAHDVALSDDDFVEVINIQETPLGEEIKLQTEQLSTLSSEVSTVVEIDVTRVTIETQYETEEIDIETEYIYTDDLRKGERDIVEAGSPKVLETVIQTEYRNNEFYQVITEELNVISEGVRRIVKVGTYVPAPPPRAVGSASRPAGLEVLDTFTATVTAYYADCPGCSGFTASGRDVRSNIHFDDSVFGTVRIIAADRQFPFGSIIHVSGVGYAIVLDRGGAVTGHILDLLKARGQGARQFGRQSLQAQVLRLGW